MSTKQMAHAAVRGRQLTFIFTHGHTEYGYLVGMDDFHWLIAIPDVRNEGVDTRLIHKSVPQIHISSTSLLSDEPPSVQAAVNEIGGPFFAHCQDQYLAPRPTSVK